jgi:1-deoxy-D-xylulose-5-phosphate synthase
MKADRRVAAVTAAMPDGTGLAEAAKAYPGRVFDVGIAEQHAVTFAAGLAAQGILPVVAIYSTFLQRAYDQVIHDVCTQGLPVLFGLDRAGIVGDDGKTHQGVFDLSFLRCVPDLVVAAPRNENELQHLVHTGIRHIAEGRGAFAVRYPRGAGTGEPLEEELRLIPIGKGEPLRRGDDLAIIAIGSAVTQALEAASLLEAQGVHATVADGRFLKPLDETLILDIAGRCKRLITLEENVVTGGFGTAVLELLAAHQMTDVQVEVIGIPDEFVEHGTPALLREKYGLTGEGIARRALAAFALKAPAAAAPR